MLSELLLLLILLSKLVLHNCYIGVLYSRLITKDNNFHLIQFRISASRPCSVYHTGLSFLWTNSQFLYHIYINHSPSRTNPYLSAIEFHTIISVRLRKNSCTSVFIHYTRFCLVNIGPGNCFILNWCWIMNDLISRNTLGPRQNGRHFADDISSAFS